MKKISTLKNADQQLLSKAMDVRSMPQSESRSAAEQGPDNHVIDAILNYSKALSIKKSLILNHIVTINN
jgi:hypothetical protein